MQAKTMIQAIAATVILTAATSWGSMIWNFDDGTSQGWKDQSGNNAEVNTQWGGNKAIFTQVQGAGTGSLSIAGLSQVIGGTSDYVQFSTQLTSAAQHTPYVFNLTTTLGSYSYVLIGENSDSGTFIDKQLNLFTDLTKQGSAPSLAVGDTVTGLSFSTWGFSFGMYADNITLAVSAVPEPASLALLALGGCCLLRRRR